MSTEIQLTNVSQVFQVRSETDRRQRDFVALRDVDLTVRSGEFLTLVGPSGCGKSTILDLISGLTRPTAGLVTADGKEITGPGPDRSVVFQQYTLLPWRTARQNIEFALEAVGGLRKAERVARAEECLALVGLSDFSNRYPHELSGGMKQRVAIARSLSYEPGVLLMDEPFGALDAQTRERLQEELVRIWRRTETTIVFITHDIEEAVFLGQRVAVMSAGPGAIRGTVDVRLDRETGEDVRASAAFGAYRHQVWQLLQQEDKETPARAVSFVA